MTKVLVTGANGHIGSNIVRVLLERGLEPVALVRRTSDTRSLDGLDVQRAIGDIMDRASLERAVEGCDYVIHTAANFSVWGDEDSIVGPSVVGTENVFAAAAGAGVRRIVCTSSCAVAGFGETPDEIRSESDWRDTSHMAYYKAKHAGERTAMACGERHGIDVVNILPTHVLGEGDWRITSSMKVVLDLFNNAGPTVDGGTNLTTARDVAIAHVNALEKGRPGERYIVGGDNVTIEELGILVTELTGVTPMHLRLPRWAFMSMARVMELGAKLTGKPPQMTRAAVRDVLGRYAFFDCSKANTELGLYPTPARAVIRETAQWLLDRGHLEPAAARRVARHLARKDAFSTAA